MKPTRSFFNFYTWYTRAIFVYTGLAKTTDFVVKTTDFWRRRRIFYFFFIFAKNPSSSPHCSPCVRHMLQCLHCILMSEAPTLSMCGHTNEGIPSTEHVQMLHWACADIIMRGNPLTDMTDNTEDANTNWQCLHTLIHPCDICLHGVLSEILHLLWLLLSCLGTKAVKFAYSAFVPLRKFNI